MGELIPDWRQRYDAANVIVRRVESRTRVRPSFLGPTHAVFEVLRQDPPEVVITDDWRGLAYAALRARSLGQGFADTAFVDYCHGPGRVLAAFARKVPDTVARFGEEVAERACLELADAVVSPSAWLLDWMREHEWPVPESARVVQNLWQSIALREPPNRAPSPMHFRRLAFFGQLREGKGVGIYLQALRTIDPALLADVEILFLGRETPRWTAERIRQELGSVATAGVRVETSLERSSALAELLVPGTLAVMPSLLDNSPYAVAECIEHEIPFLATAVGGVPELIDEGDRERFLVEPTAPALAAALREAISRSDGYSPAKPARAPEESLQSWLELVETVAPRATSYSAPAHRVSVVALGSESPSRAHRLASGASTVDVEVVEATSRTDGVRQATAEWVLFLDEEDDPDSGLLDRLVAAQAASGAGVVSVAAHPADDPEAVQLFLGDPGALGLVENQYGVVALIRRALIDERMLADGSDPDWPLLATLVLRGARVVSLPIPLSLHAGRPGVVADVPGEGLAVLRAFEEYGGELRDLPQLAATVAAALAREQRSTPASTDERGRLERALRLVRREGVVGAARRAGRFGRRR